MSKIQITEEKGNDIKTELYPLLEKHWNEIAQFKDFPLAPNWKLYDVLENQGLYKMFTARCEGKLIGYVSYTLQGHHHYATTLHAMDDVLFVDPEYRTGRLGLELIKFAEQELRKYGAKVIYHHTKAAHNIGKLFEHLDYELTDLIYAKKL